ncbi:MAG: hypothetical protein LBU10_04980 [Endomicrobium sp.]|jgi:hypothetical protein|nr:hypothetical protein [Endomicrobium sp.]
MQAIKKADLLVSGKASEHEKRKTDLGTTAYIQKLVQKMAGLHFGFGVNTLGGRKKFSFTSEEN